jgi:hypothetical protein
MIWTRVGQEHANDFKQSVKEGLTKLQSRNNKVWRKVWPNRNQEITKCEGRWPTFNQDTILIIEKKFHICIIYHRTDFYVNIKKYYLTIYSYINFLYYKFGY